MVTCLKPNVNEQIGPGESCKICLPATPLFSQLRPWRVSRRGSARTRDAPGPAVHLHEHVPVHVPRRQQVAGRMERQPTGRSFQNDVFRGVTDAGRDFGGVGVSLVAPIPCGPLFTRVVHAREDCEARGRRADRPGTRPRAEAAAQSPLPHRRGGTGSGSGAPPTRKGRPPAAHVGGADPSGLVALPGGLLSRDARFLAS